MASSPELCLSVLVKQVCADRKEESYGLCMMDQP